VREYSAGLQEALEPAAESIAVLQRHSSIPRDNWLGLSEHGTDSHDSVGPIGGSGGAARRRLALRLLAVHPRAQCTAQERSLAHAQRRIGNPEFKNERGKLPRLALPGVGAPVIDRPTRVPRNVYWGMIRSDTQIYAIFSLC